MVLVQGPIVSILVVLSNDPKEVEPPLLELIGPGKQVGDKSMRPLTVEPIPIDTTGIIQDTVQPFRMVTENDFMEPADPGLPPES